MRTINEEIRNEVHKLVKEYFADECEVDINEIKDDTRIIEDLDGDSLMYLSLLELIKKKYNIQVEIKAIGKKLMEQQADTIGQVVDMVLTFIETN